MHETAPFLDPAECATIAERLFGLRDHWTTRTSVGGRAFYTAGAASYLDAPHVPTYYYRRAGPLNTGLRFHFGSLYPRLLRTLGDLLGGPVDFEPGFALPGFHVFLAEEGHEWSTASIHRDLQYRGLTFRRGEVDPDRTLSFTVAIQLPERGAGLLLWDNRSETPPDPVTEPPSYVPYRVGEIVLHSGMLWHSIAPMTDPAPGDARVSLQGHGVEIDGAWSIYW